MTAVGFKPRATKVQNEEAAASWLEKAIAAEAEGKSASMVDKILNRAVMYEDAGLNMK